jgi:hypothetical protein
MLEHPSHPTFLLEKRNTENRVRKSHITTETTQLLQQRIQDDPPKSPLYPPSRRDVSTHMSQRDAQKATAQLRERIGNGIILLLTKPEFERYLQKIWTAIRHDPEMPQVWIPDLNDAPEGLIERVLALKHITGECMDIFESANITSSGALAYLHSVVLAEYSDFLADRLDTQPNQEEARERILKQQENLPESYIRTLTEQTTFHTIRLDEALNKGQGGVITAQEHAKQLVFDLASYVFYYERRPFIIQDEPLPF